MRKKIRYAVVGLGHIAQVAVLPAFKKARNSKLTALVSGAPEKLKTLSKKYRISNCYTYEEYEQCLTSGNIDAVYIALPNTLHRTFSERAAQHGIHVLCEKPMAVTEEECQSMIQASEENRVKLMIAYRLHFEKTNMRAVRIAQSGKLGNLRIFNSSFTMQVRDEENIRLQSGLGGGTLYDIGIYCINAARYVFRDEPLEVVAFSAKSGDERFSEVDEMTSAILRFPQERLATFTCSFGASDSGFYEVVGTRASLWVDPAYEYAEGLAYEIIRGEKTRKFRFSKRDQFGPELAYFSDCILKNRDPEPSGIEGLADVRIINALYESAKTGRAVRVSPVEKAQRPGLRQVIEKPPTTEPKAIEAKSPHGA